ncbi:MAG: hypothetical protein IJX97_04875 [Clostridia bacterium]|nr:hypothetical protein [Clostridia bacterium]
MDLTNVTAVWEQVKDVLLIDKVVNRLTQYWNMIPEWVFDFYYEHRLACLVVAICALCVIAFEGYKLFKMFMYILGPATFAICGYMWLAPIASQYAVGVIPDFIRVDALVAVVCALLAVFLTRCAHTLMIMILGGVTGYFFGYIYAWRVIRDFFNTLQFLKDPVARYIISGVCAAVFVLLFILMFKHVFMVGSAFGCLAFAGLLLQKLVVPCADDMMKWCFIICGAVIGGFAVVHQYKEEEKSLEIVF